MNKVVKTIAYIVACVALFLILLQSYSSSFRTSEANSFAWKKTVSIYFIDFEKVRKGECEADIALSRNIANAETLGPGALEALIKGRAGGEEDVYHTSLSPDTLVQKFEIINGVAYVDFNSKLDADVKDECHALSVRSQIEKTLIDLPDINSVVLSINGKTEGVLEP